MEPTKPETCDRCGGQYQAGLLAGFCPRCLLEDTVNELQESDHPALRTSPAGGRCPKISDLDEQMEGLQFIELIGRGGSGWTFLATQKSLSRLVAVKVLWRDGVDRDLTASRFQREAESLAKLNHPGIVTVHDFGVTESFLYLSMEYVNGPTLRQRLARRSLGPHRALKIAKQLCQAVQAAHDAGVLHRDIKPENILFDSDSEDASIKVADFGIAKLFSHSQETQHTVTEMVAGTPYYMAPEYHRALDTSSRKTDVYSMGVVVYEMLTGRLPLGKFPAPSEVISCSKSVDQAVFSALENSPNDRMADLHTFANSLDGKPPWISATTLFRYALRTLIVTGVFFAGAWLGTQTFSRIEPNPQNMSLAPSSNASSPNPAPEDSAIDEGNPFLKEWPEEPNQDLKEPVQESPK